MSKDYELKISTDKTKIVAFKGKHLVRSKIEIDGSILEQVRPASWSSGQSLCLMRSRVRFPALPWEFSLKGRIPAMTMVWVGW